MDKEQVIKIVREYKKAIASIVDNAQVYLYGSYSKGTAHTDSDIDVAVIVPKLDGDWLETTTNLWLIAPKINCLIEPVLIDKRHESPLYEDVLKSGIAV